MSTDTIRIGFTGTQHGMTREQKRTLNKIIKNIRREYKGRPVCLHHGDCIGADAEANTIARSLKIQTAAHPPIKPDKRAFCEVDRTHPEKDYLERNRDIVSSTMCLFAAPQTAEEVLRSGTWATIRHSDRVGKPCIIIEPDGSTRVYPSKRSTK